MQVFSIPDTVHVPDFEESIIDGRYSMEKDNELREKFINDLIADVKGRGWTGKETGQMIQFPMGDGYAEYMVIHQPGASPSMALLHLPLGDAWAIPDAHVRGLRIKDVRDKIAGQKRMAELFGRKKEVT